MFKFAFVVVSTATWNCRRCLACLLLSSFPSPALQFGKLSVLLWSRKQEHAGFLRNCAACAWLLSGPDPITSDQERIWRLAVYNLIPLSRLNLWKCTRFCSGSIIFQRSEAKRLLTLRNQFLCYHIIPSRSLMCLKRTVLDSLHRCELKLSCW